jgi:hypothetical protein
MRSTRHSSDDTKSLQESTEDEQDTEDERLIERYGSHSCSEELSDAVNDNLNQTLCECPMVVSNEHHFASLDKYIEITSVGSSQDKIKGSEKRDSSSIRNIQCTGPDSVLEKIVKALKDWSTKIFEPPPVAFERITPTVMLHGCMTPEDHYATIKRVVQISIEMEGLNGLKECGFHYEFTPCTVHKGVKNSDTLSMCPDCCGNRLYHTESGTLITQTNRKNFIADGEMYEACTGLCQEYAQELMQREGDLHWVSVCEDEEKGTPIRVLVDKDYPLHVKHFEQKSDVDDAKMSNENENNDPTKPTLLIITGKGKVRAGIFSRQHLLVSSIESSTALPMIQDAKKRNMRVAILDPNARGDRNGMSTFEESMRTLFGREINESDTDDPHHGPVYILSHSASGSQLTRYLQTEGHHLLRHIKSIAFTDSTHSIQWLKDHHDIASFFQGPASLYIRSSNEDRDYDWQNHRPGDIASTDEHWQHRFGQIQTVWAGTNDHSLTNWYSHSCIWDHFDRCSNRKDEQNADKPPKTL